MFAVFAKLKPIRDQRRCADVRKQTVIRRIFGIRGKLRIFRRRYIVGTLTNKANVSILYYLISYRLSTDSETRDLELPRMAILR